MSEDHTTEAAPHLNSVDWFNYQRRSSHQVHVGNLTLGGDAPLRIQSMTTADTMDIEKTVAESERMIDAGCELVRITAPSKKEAEALKTIADALHEKGHNVPLVADIHFTPNAAEIAADHVEKIRVNPGNYADKKRFEDIEYTDASYAEELERIRERFTPLVLKCKALGRAMRIGTNHGSLSDRIMSRYGDTPKGMVESAMEFLRICRDNDYHNLVISMKASNPQVMVQAYRLLVASMDAEGMHYPLHLGVTEAGDGDYGRIKSTAGIATLLADGLGDTIRVSLTEAPEKEIPVCYSILQSLGLRKTMVEYVSCPSCGRTLFNLEDVLNQVRNATSHLTGLDIAVMGCIVNGPGEMADADYGYVGKTPGVISLYRGRDEIRRVPEAEGVEALIALIKEDGRWVDP